MDNSTDDKILNLISQVDKQKAEIKSIEKPAYKTNMSFSYSEGRSNDAINLHVVNDLRQLMMIAAYLRAIFSNYETVGNVLGSEMTPGFTWQGFSYSDWFADLKMKVAKIQIGAKKKKLELLESRLNAIVSPELRAKLELESIERELA